jgi:hypothetical protein
LDPYSGDVCIEDIAHSLSLQCRFAGHVREFYSVAQHSVLVSYACIPEDARWGLLHDAAEAYLVDLPRPVKKSVMGYKEAETAVLGSIALHFGLPSFDVPVVSDNVIVTDNDALVTEARDLMAPCEQLWEFPPYAKAWPDRIQPWDPREAELRFLQRAVELDLFGAVEALRHISYDVSVVVTAHVESKHRCNNSCMFIQLQMLGRDGATCRLYDRVLYRDTRYKEHGYKRCKECMKGELPNAAR